MGEGYLEKYLKNQEQKRMEKAEEGTIKKINVDKLDSFEGHIFSKLANFKFEELKQSIKYNGIISPLIVRKKDNERFEIISGHNRIQCAKELGMKEITCIIKELDDNQANLLMIDTNLVQREEIILSEKGLAYRKKLELLKEKRKNKNAKIDSDTKGLEEGVHIEHLKSIDELTSENDDGRTTIQRLIRITYLIKELQEKVDINVIPLLVAVKLSHINEEKQVMINNIINQKKLTISIKQAEKLKKQNSQLTEESILEILDNTVKEKANSNKFNGKIERKIIKKYKEKFKTNVAFNKLLETLLEKHFESEKIYGGQ